MLTNRRVCEKCLGGRYYNCLLTRCHKGSLNASLVYTIEAYYTRIFNKYSHIRYFIFPSNFTLKKHADAGIPEEKLVHIPNFINVENFEPSYENKRYILFAGRLSREKGVLALLKAVKGLDIPVKIVGDGPMRVEYERFVEENSIDNVSFEGYKSGDELKELFRNSAFVVFPSEWYENAPMTILESFAYGKPVLGSNIGGIPEMVIDGETGLLFKTGDHPELKEKINYLFQHPSIIKEMGRKARERVEKEYNAEMHYNRLMYVYKVTLL
jgi:glycosyltransferase involved in cell wall biosynthesis